MATDDYGFLGRQPPRAPTPFGPTAQDIVNDTAASPGGVLQVTLPDGNQYTPMTSVKNDTQSIVYGAPLHSVVPIMVPPGVDPQVMVDQRNGQSPVSPEDDANFAQTWWPGGPNDYKRTHGAAYDAYGNFEYGATGAKMGQPSDALTGMGHAISYWIHGKPNDPINTKDIQSGADAIIKGGTLNVVPKP